MENSRKARLARIAWAAACFFTAGLALSSLFAAWAWISGPSMEPTLHGGELYVGPRRFEPAYGDIVLIDDSGRDRVLVKRVIGLAGDRIEVMPDGSATRNGEELDEPYAVLREGIHDGTLEYEVPEGHVFVLGDNRGDSEDSRSAKIGYVDARRLIGRVDVRVWPPEMPGWLRGPDGGGYHEE